jgi:alkanesulfonate monooxygenase SsuD/methylene tetrahydromethanopterin reductase-like flavin-dependent oxidoreductase (luciferase family)
MKFGTYHTFQAPPWKTTDQVYAEEFASVDLAEQLGYDSVWVPEQHFFDYCACPDAIDMSMHLLGRTKRVRVGAAVVNQSLTHPLRFAERAALLDHVGGGRVDLCIGRGYQWPQNVVFEVDEATTKARFTESIDVILDAWTGERHGYDGEFFSFPPVRTWPAPARRPEEVLLMSVGGSTPIEETVQRGLPLALASPFAPVANTAETMSRYVALVEESPLDTDLILDRAIVLLYMLIAPSKAEAHDLQKRPYEWHMSRLAALSVPVRPIEEWETLIPDYEGGDAPAPEPIPEISDDDWQRQIDTNLVFDDPAGCIEKIELLHDAGVRNVVCWMGVGGIAHEHVARSMQLFADEVAPRFAN